MIFILVLIFYLLFFLILQLKPFTDKHSSMLHSLISLFFSSINLDKNCGSPQILTYSLHFLNNFKVNPNHHHHHRFSFQLLIKFLQTQTSSPSILPPSLLHGYIPVFSSLLSSHPLSIYLIIYLLISFLLSRFHVLSMHSTSLYSV